MELRVKNEFLNVKDRRLHLLQIGKWADCRFLVGAVPESKKIFQCHKLILAMTSPVFERMFYGEFKEDVAPIAIPDIEPSTFQNMLEYIYTGEIKISSFGVASELLYVAKKYMLSCLVEYCTDSLKSILNSNNACRIYEFAEFFEESKLMESSMQFIVREIKAVLLDPDFIKIEMSTLMTILERNDLNVYSELELFRGLLRFVSKEPVKNVEKKENKTGFSSFKNFSNIHQTITKEEVVNQAIKKIRFLTMTPEEFTQEPVRSKLLQEHKAFAILINILNPYNCAMPDGFCDSRSKRRWIETASRSHRKRGY